jgi:CheY-like chemotaxis protein
MRRLHLVVVEDNPADLGSLEVILQTMALSYDLVLASDGEEAIDCLLRRGAFADFPPPDLILLDIDLPRINGIEVLREVPGSKDLPICVLTSSEEEREAVEQHFHLEGHNYIVKPVNREKLLNCFRCFEHLRPLAEELERAA